ncbi:OmpA/MotB family protein [Bisbaumannia pacifica]|uniref:OmpA family protein n=1 Tax=Bisbaumannia pacifica TaxID=77098 RepID=A0ABD4L2I1_9GAMM|nr:OmpA family protein [Halomonas pacifica]MBH8580930.1 OmpA family protein [Halomonas pacifica]
MAKLRSLKGRPEAPPPPPPTPSTQAAELLPQRNGGDGDGESWLMSYLDVLTLLITLFVLLLSMTNLQSGEDSESGAPRLTIPALQAAERVAGPLGSGLLPREEAGREPVAQLDLEGVSVAETEQGITLRIDDQLLFSSGDATLTGPGRELLSGLIPTLESFPGRLSVEGHSDNVPIATARFPSNWELSTARASAVLRDLERQGIDATRMRAIGYADTRPLADNASAEGRAANRRVEILLHTQAAD